MEKALSLEDRFSRLLSFLRESQSAVLAFSGGVDSSFLLKAMKEAQMKVLAVTAISGTMPGKDVENCLSVIREIGADHRTIRTEELSNESFLENTPERCFFCKSDLFVKLKKIAADEGYRHLFDGSNADDLRDHRPGRKAAELHGVRSPLADHGLTKDQIRALSKRFGLKTWDRPSSPCLSSRFPYGRRITAEALKRVEKAEEFIRALGVRELRVRDYGESARIEVAEEDMPIVLTGENRRLITERLKSLGYEYISVDLEGFKSGNMNRTIGEHRGIKAGNS